MQSEDIANGNSKENKPPVNFILGGENDPEIIIEEVPDEYPRDDDNTEEKEDSFPQGLKTPNSFESRSANNSYVNMFGLGERKKRLRMHGSKRRTQNAFAKKLSKALIIASADYHFSSSFVPSRNTQRRHLRITV